MAATRQQIASVAANNDGYQNQQQFSYEHEMPPTYRFGADRSLSAFPRKRITDISRYLVSEVAPCIATHTSPTHCTTPKSEASYHTKYRIQVILYTVRLRTWHVVCELFRVATVSKRCEACGSLQSDDPIQKIGTANK